MSKKEKLQDIPAEIRPFLTREEFCKQEPLVVQQQLPQPVVLADQHQMLQLQPQKVLIIQSLLKKLFGQIGLFTCQLMKTQKHTQI